MGPLVFPRRRHQTFDVLATRGVDMVDPSRPANNSPGPGLHVPGGILRSIRIDTRHSHNADHMLPVTLQTQCARLREGYVPFAVHIDCHRPAIADVAGPVPNFRNRREYVVMDTHFDCRS